MGSRCARLVRRAEHDDGPVGTRQRLVQQGQVALVQRLEAAYENGGVVHGFKCSLNNSVQRLFIGR